MTCVQPGRSKEDGVALKSKLSLNWTGPFKALRLGPCASAPDGKPVGEKLLYFDLPAGMRGVKAKSRVSVMRCLNSHDADDRPRYLPAGFTEYVLVNVSEKCPHFHVTDIDVEPFVGVERLEVDSIVAHQFVRGWGGKLCRRDGATLLPREHSVQHVQGPTHHSGQHQEQALSQKRNACRQSLEPGKHHAKRHQSRALAPRAKPVQPPGGRR